MRNKKDRGFTLIELILVIAIIGLLSTIVFAALGESRAKGQNTKIKQQLNSIRTAANLYYTRTGHYGNEVTGSCTGGGAAGANHAYMFRDTTSGMYNIVGVTASWPTGATRTCYVDGQRWAVSVTLLGSGEGGFANWCVDNTGASKGRSVPITNANGC